jgi:hypothetical protein
MGPGQRIWSHCGGRWSELTHLANGTVTKEKQTRTKDEQGET